MKSSHDGDPLHNRGAQFALPAKTPPSQPSGGLIDPTVQVLHRAAQGERGIRAKPKPVMGGGLLNRVNWRLASETAELGGLLAPAVPPAGRRVRAVGEMPLQGVAGQQDALVTYLSRFQAQPRPELMDRGLSLMGSGLLPPDAFVLMRREIAGTR